MNAEQKKHQNLADRIEKESKQYVNDVEKMEIKNNEKLLKCYKRNDELKEEIKQLNEKYN